MDASLDVNCVSNTERTHYNWIDYFTIPIHIPFYITWRINPNLENREETRRPAGGYVMCKVPFGISFDVIHGVISIF